MTTFDANHRSHSLEQMSDSEGLDVLVIGGGITGAGIALDAVTRGLRVGIVEAQDWASGTSSRSSKLVHGGLRYLQMFDFKLVHEALIERDRLTNTLAPHLVWATPFLYPLKTPVIERAYVGAGIGLYDALASATSNKRAMPFHRHYSHDKLMEVFPDFNPDAAVGAIQYWDAQVDDARLVLTLVKTAVKYGALAASRTQVTSLRKEGGRVTGADVVDLETGATHSIKANAVINATGVWTEETEALTGAEGGLKVLASKGVHLVVPRDRIEGERGLILQTEKSVLFIIPWPDYWIIGTTDTPYTEDFVHPVVTKTDIDYVLEHANAALKTPLTHDDIVGTYAGLRPLLQPGTKEGTSSAKVSREHTVASPMPGFVAIAGGKLTTYRVMAEDAVDFALGERAKSLPSITASLPLWGAEGLSVAQRRAPQLARKYGWTKKQAQHLLNRYGSGVSELVELIEEDPSLAQPLEHAPSYLRAEIAYAAREESVLHLEDVMLHRTRLIYEQLDSGAAALDEILSIIAPIVGWDDQVAQQEKQAYLDRLEAENRAAETATDAEGAARRAEAADLRPMRHLKTNDKDVV